MILSQNDSEYLSLKSKAAVIILFEKFCTVQSLYIYFTFSLIISGFIFFCISLFVTSLIT